MDNPSTILVVDDTPQNLHSFKAVLQHTGLNIATASSGEEALKYLTKQSVSLVLLDVQMPGMNGFETAQLIRQRRDLQDLPILFISAAWDSADFINQGYDSGAYDYLVKPIDSQVLVNKVMLFHRLYSQQKQLEGRHRVSEDLNLALQNNKALQQARIDAENSEKAQRIFLSQMSHELRTPLNAVIGLSAALVSDTDQIHSEKQSEYLAAIHEAGKHLLQLIGDILDLSKINSGTRILEHQPFTISELLDICHRTFSLACQDKGLSLTIDNQLNGDCSVLGDITVLKQILFNLLGNAIKFTEKGSVSLTAASRATSEADPNPGVVFTVTDTGKGIKTGAIPQLFKPFVQEDNSITRSYGGSGLGLHISESLAQLMAGGINCTSSEGHGSTFEVVVYLERNTEVLEELDVMPAGMLNLPPLKLLAVDDVDLNLLVTIALLTPQGHTVETVNNSQEALEMASNNDYDAILMDVHMPVMDGMETTQLIRNLDNTKRAAVPIIALSADVDVKQQDLFIAAGMNAAVGKPWRAEDLEKELTSILNLSL